jgi:hypothetical protein
MGRPYNKVGFDRDNQLGFIAERISVEPSRAGYDGSEGQNIFPADLRCVQGGSTTFARARRDRSQTRGRWSHDYRPLPFDGGYLPVVEVTRAVLGTGFRGWFSVEIFDARLQEKHGDDMAALAKKAMEIHERLVREAGGE